MIQGQVKVKGDSLEQKLVTPVGIAKFPKLNQPDKTFDKEHGAFSVDLVLGEKEAMELSNEIDQFTAQALEHVKKIKGISSIKLHDNPLKREKDKEGNETGNYTIKAKAKAQYISSIPVFKADGQPFSDLVTFGSKIQIQTTMASYVTSGKLGVTLRLSAVLVRELAENKSGTAKGYFGDMIADSSDL